VPIEEDILEPGTTNILHLTGEVHVVTHFRVSDQGVPSVGIWANLVRVRGTSPVTGRTYLAVGAGNVAWTGVSPGPPNIPEQQLEFALVNLGISPGPRTLPRNRNCRTIRRPRIFRTSSPTTAHAALWTARRRTWTTRR
jgi:hypothetical protein